MSWWGGEPEAELETEAEPEPRDMQSQSQRRPEADKLPETLAKHGIDVPARFAMSPLLSQFF